jgi:nucleoid-associated protein YgaU
MAYRRSVTDTWGKMSKFALANGASGLVLGGAAAVGAVVLAVYVSGSLFPASDPVAESPVVENSRTPQPTTEPEAAPVVSQPAPAAVPVSPEPEDVAEEEAAEQPASQEDISDVPSDAPTETAEMVEPPEPIAPAFDVVRVAPDGQTLVAGRAPGARDVTILVDDVDAGLAVVDGSGKFVAFLDLPPSDAPRVIRLVADGDLGRVESDDQIILAPVQRVAEAPTPTPEPDVPAETAAEIASGDDAVAGAAAEAATVETTVASVAETVADSVSEAQRPVVDEPATEPSAVEAPAAAEAAPIVQAEAPDVPPSPSVEAAVPDVEVSSNPVTAPDVETTLAEVSDAPSAPAVILSTEEGVNVLQTGSKTPELLDQIALDAITYEDAGSVALSGRGLVNEFVRIYLDNQPILTTEIGVDGQWRAELPDVDTGTYTLRVDAVDADGDVTSRVESPFRREDPVVLAEAADRAAGPSVIRVVTVQPGNTLWAIARDRYGEGPAYVKVFDANRDRIRDPDLIYPGQVFSIPD